MSTSDGAGAPLTLEPPHAREESGLRATAALEDHLPAPHCF